MGRRASGIRTQDFNASSRMLLREQKERRTYAFPFSKRKRIRYVYLWACFQFHFGSIRNGSSCQDDKPPRTPRSSHYRRRRNERWLGFRGFEQCFEPAQRLAHHLERQRYVDRQSRWRYATIPAQPRYKRNLQQASFQGIAMVARQRHIERQATQGHYSPEQRHQVGSCPTAEPLRGYGHTLLRTIRRARCQGNCKGVEPT